MKIKYILGYYHEPNAGERMMDHLFMQAMKYPMLVETPVEWLDATPAMPNKIYLTDDPGLEMWANSTFEEYEIGELVVPVEAVDDEMKVWAVMWHVHYELGDLEGVYSSKDKAEEHAERIGPREGETVEVVELE